MSETYKKRSCRIRRNWRMARNDYHYKENRYFNLVEKMFYLYNKIKAEVADIRAEQGYYQSGHREGGGSSNHAFVSDPTYQIATKRLKPISKVVINSGTLNEDTINRPEEWLLVVEMTFRYFADVPLVTEVIRRRYLENESMPITCAELGFTDADGKKNNYNKYYDLRNAGIRYAREVAIQLGLIKLFEIKKE